MERVTDKEYWMDGKLRLFLDTIVYNVGQDFDFLGLISGDGMVRVGKSMIGQQIGYYIAHHLNTPFSVENIVFNGEELREVAFKLPPNSVIIYDEARGELDNKKMMEKVTRRLLDFFAECGYLNHIIILILPDYFELPKGLAINRSEFLINCRRGSEEAKNKAGVRVNKYIRGLWEFYNRTGKKRLYIDGKKNYDDYRKGKPIAYGEFRKYWVIDEAEYRAKKTAHVKRQQQEDTAAQRLRLALASLCEHVTQREAADILTEKGWKVSHSMINQLIKEPSRRKAGI